MIVKDKEHKQNYTVLNNACLEDDSLSWEARGVLAYLLSRPSDWEPSQTHIAQQGKMGRTKVRRIFAELEEAGYLKKSQARLTTGRFGTAAQIVFETPRKGVASTEVPLDAKMERNPHAVKPTTGEPTTRNPTTVNRDAVGDTLISTEVISTEYITSTEVKKGDANAPQPAKAKQKKVSKNIDPKTVIMDDRVNQQAWNEWIEHKYGTKAVAKGTITKLMNTFASLPPGQQQAMVDYSMSNGYKGLFADRFAKPASGMTAEQEQGQMRAVERLARVAAKNIEKAQQPKEVLYEVL